MSSSHHAPLHSESVMLDLGPVTPESGHADLHLSFMLLHPTQGHWALAHVQDDKSLVHGRANTTTALTRFHVHTDGQF